MRSRILVVGRDVVLRARLARMLTGAGYSAELAESAAHARRIRCKGIALTIVVPEGLGPEGDSFIDELKRSVGATLLLSMPPVAHAGGADLIDAMDEAALLNRVDEALRPVPEADTEDSVLQFAQYRLDLAGQSLVYPSGEEVLLSRGEFRLLQAFVERPGRVLSRDYLLQTLAGRDAEVFDRSVDMLVMRLRRKIEPDPKHPSLIITVPGSGYKFVAKVRQVKEVAPSEPVAVPPEAALSTPERRYVTALAAELIGRLPEDPEELRAVIDDYRRYAAIVITRYGGSMAQRQVRDVLAWFGYPVAQEHAAECAIHAGLALAEHLAEGGAAISPGLAARIGVASGLVLADPAGEVLGETPGAAARLHDLAAPGQVIVSTSTRRLAGGLFEYRDLGALTLKGATDSLHAWHVLGPSPFGSRSEALYGGALRPQIGRDEELDLLLRRWRQAKSGEGQLVLISGEPGFGKSRLLAALEERLAGEPHVSLRYFCSPHHQDSPLHPVIARWEQQAGFTRGDSAVDRLRKLEAMLAPARLAPEDVALLAAMLSIPTEQRYPALELSPQRRKERTFAALLSRLGSAARTAPQLMLFEDAHWADPSSLELLDRLVDRLAELPILVVLSFRPEFTPPWIGRAGSSLITLNRLDRRQSAALAMQITADRMLPTALLDHIVAQTDGVPLFIEELSKAALETSLGADAARPLAIPVTLQGTLMARLDRLPAAKQVAQIGAVIGREFPYALLAAMAALPEMQLAQGLDELVSSGLASRRGVPPDAAYTFKHALVQNAAYDSLLKSQRASVHAQITELLIAREPGIEETRPELLAYHYELAGLAERAIEGYTKAAWRSEMRAAFEEARAHFEHALRLTRAALHGEARDRSELLIYHGIGNIEQWKWGYASSQYGVFLKQQIELCARLGYPVNFLSSGFGLFVFHVNRCELDSALGIAEHLMRWGEERNDVRGRILGSACAGATRLRFGDLGPARADLERVLALHQAAEGDSNVVWTYRETVNRWLPVRLAHVFLAHVTCWGGEPDRALNHIAVAIKLSQAEGFATAIPQAKFFRLQVLSWLMEPSMLADSIEELIGLCAAQDIPHFGAAAKILKGYVIACAGDAGSGHALITEGLAAYEATESVTWTSYYRALLAETCLMLGRTRDARDILAAAMAQTERTGERWYAAELHRRLGEIYRHLGDDPAAEAQFVVASKIARQQGARLWELNAAASHARLLRDKDQTAAARCLLTGVLRSFSEGFDTTPLRNARRLLDAL